MKNELVQNAAGRLVPRFINGVEHPLLISARLFSLLSRRWKLIYKKTGYEN
ncbi:MAG: hypothetical protein HQ591_08020 [candidate division Zixibacteria bacterium]|nr:hypothetical protein [Candidatus Tariuqbacter arcticus]